MKLEKENYYSKHDARVVTMFISMCLITLIIYAIFKLITWYVFHHMLDDSTWLIALIWAEFIMWKTNIRFGYVENILENKKKYPQLSVWFVKVKI